MPYINKVEIMGHLGRDAETKFTPSGASLTTMSIATTRRWQKNGEWQQETTWHKVKSWNLPNPEKYLKGDSVYVEGRFETSEYQNREGKKATSTAVVSNRVMLVKSKGVPEPADEEQAIAAHGLPGDVEGVPF